MWSQLHGKQNKTKQHIEPENDHKFVWFWLKALHRHTYLVMYSYFQERHFLGFLFFLFRKSIFCFPFPSSAVVFNNHTEFDCKCCLSFETFFPNKTCREASYPRVTRKLNSLCVELFFSQCSS